MNSNEIKNNLSMPELMARYGIAISHNMCRCPFHGKDLHPSMKVFKDGAKCFACGWNGDIFKFYMDIEKTDFKTAFKALGGEYEKHRDERKRKITKSRYERARNVQNRESNEKKKFKKRFGEAIQKCREIINDSEPLSDEWCLAQNKLPLLFYAWELKYVREEDIDEIDVIRVCEQIERI